ncbi:hypothetical protein L195_g034512 [Trifolium pratense]|uniref:Uncharacterized protein n=1 Tax=Trifolium pratense TaxID=57577 RepID=A0A2K3LJ13_TRIPR|nr:hypothetical protein L195_g034512 [Trifolium pratense]
MNWLTTHITGILVCFKVGVSNSNITFLFIGVFNDYVLDEISKSVCAYASIDAWSSSIGSGNELNMYLNTRVRGSIPTEGKNSTKEGNREDREVAALRLSTKYVKNGAYPRSICCLLWRPPIFGPSVVVDFTFQLVQSWT